MEIVSYLIKSVYIERVIKELHESFCGLEILIKDEGHDFYLIKFKTYNNRIVNITEFDIESFSIFFRFMTDSIMSYEIVYGNEE